MQDGHPAVRRAHQGVGVVLHVVVPERVGDETVDLGELPGEQAQQVHHVDSLVQQHAAAGKRPLGAPRGLAEGDRLRLAVHAAQVDHLAELTVPHDLQGVADGIVIAVVEAVLELEGGMPALAGDDPDHVGDVPSGRLFAEHVQAAFEPGDGDLGVDVVGQADEQHVQVLIQDPLVMGVVAHPVVERPFPVQAAVAHGHRL